MPHGQLTVFNICELIFLHSYSFFFEFFLLMQLQFQNFPNYSFMQLQFFLPELILHKYSVEGYRCRWRQEGLDLARSRGRSWHLTTTFKMPASEHGHAWSPGFASYYQESGGLHLPHNCEVSLRVLIGSTTIALRGTQSILTCNL